MKPSSAESPQDTSTSKRDAADTPRRIQLQELLGGQKEILIEHAGCEYRLRITRQNKLILTK